MEFDELKKIWHIQDQQPLYAFSEQNLHNHITARKDEARKISNISEWIGMIAYAATGTVTITLNIMNKSGNLFLYLLAVWMLASAAYILFSRLYRLNGTTVFDRSMQGDLAHAISLATYQVHISLLMQWNALPIAILTALSLWYSTKSWWIVGGAILFFSAASFGSVWEHGIYRSKKRSLQALLQKLEAAEKE